MDNESDQSKESGYPKLEPRRNRTASYGEEPARAAKEDRRANDNTAFYLIEREAVRLRRLRWDQSPAARTACAKIDEAATRAASPPASRRTPGAGRAQQAAEPLAQYARGKDQPSPRPAEPAR